MKWCCIFCLLQIADFGLSKNLDSEYYFSKGGMVPVKWTAPEVQQNSSAVSSCLGVAGALVHRACASDCCSSASIHCCNETGSPCCVYRGYTTALL